MQANDNKRQPSGTGLDRCEKVFTFFQRVQVQLGAGTESGRRAGQFYLDSCLISYIILSCINSIYGKAAALFNKMQRVGN